MKKLVNTEAIDEDTRKQVHALLQNIDSFLSYIEDNHNADEDRLNPAVKELYWSLNHWWYSYDLKIDDWK